MEPQRAPDYVISNALMRLVRDLLTLRPEHRAQLRARGLTDAQIARARFVSAPSTRAERKKAAEAISGYLDASGGGVPGFYRDGRGRWGMVFRPPGFFVPVRDGCGHIQALSQRVDRPTGADKYIWFSSNPDAVDDGGRQKYPLGASSGTPPHVAGRDLLYSAPEVTITEGALKAEVASCLSGSPVVGVAGTHAFRGLAARLKTGYPLLRRVLVAYDRDMLEKPQVLEATLKLSAELEAEGYAVKVRTWPGSEKGLDDYLLAQISSREVAA